MYSPIRGGWLLIGLQPDDWHLFVAVKYCAQVYALYTVLGESRENVAIC